MPPLKVASFGTKGVNVVDSPLHLSDDDLVAAQNAEIFQEDGYPAIRKRLGMIAGLTGPMDGAVYALTSIPLPDPSTPVLLYGSVIIRPNGYTGGDELETSDDGVTWTPVADVLGGMTDTTNWPVPAVPQQLPIFKDGSDNYYTIYIASVGSEWRAYRYNGPLADNTQVAADLTGVGDNSHQLQGIAWPKPYSDHFFVLFRGSALDNMQRISEVNASTGVVTAEYSQTFADAGADEPDLFVEDIACFNTLVFMASVETAGDGWNICRISSADEMGGHSTAILHENTIDEDDAGHLNNWTFMPGDSYLLAGCTAADTNARVRLLRREANNATWTEIYDAGTGFKAIYPVYSVGDEFLFWLYDSATQDLTLYRSTNAGSSWTSVVTRAGVSSYPNQFTEMVRVGSIYVWVEMSSGGGPFDEDVMNYEVGVGESVATTISLPGARGLAMIGALPAGGD